jgi:predicted DNA-binding ribbon-helix-helix protein
MAPGPAGIRKRSLAIAGHRTSVSLEPAFWDALNRLAEARGISAQGLVAEIDRDRVGGNLSSAIRVYLLAAAAEGALPKAP